jgi:hypothetical protein
VAYSATPENCWNQRRLLSHDLILVPSQGLPPAIIASSGRKARDRIEHFLRAAKGYRKLVSRSQRSFATLYSWRRTIWPPRNPIILP